MASVETPMELLFHSLAHVLHAKIEDSAKKSLASTRQVLEGMLGWARSQGFYDPSLPVGEDRLPLVHALARLKDLPVSWMEVFSKDPADTMFFVPVEGKDLGAVMFDRMMGGISRLHSPALEWWIKNVPQLPPAQSQKWVESLSRKKSPDIYYSFNKSSEDGALRFIGLLLERGVGLSKEEPGRPQERWFQEEVWWQKLSEQGRLQELVMAPSGAMRPMDEVINLGGGQNGKFASWKGAPRLREDATAPHGRKKELVDDWVLHSQEAPVGERARRLALSINKSEGVLDELCERCVSPNPRKKDPRPLLREILSHRTPAGMNLAGWFILHSGDERLWTGHEAALFGVDPSKVVPGVVAPDGAGLLLQALRAHVGTGAGELPCWSHGSVRTIDKSSLQEPLRKALGGDPSTHTEFSQLLVDTLVCPSPLSFSRRIAELALGLGLLSNHDTECVEQALMVAEMVFASKSAISQANNARNSTKSNKYTSRSYAQDALKATTAFHERVCRQGCALSLTARDWDTLMAEWKLLPKHALIVSSALSEAFKSLAQELRSQGERLALAEETISAQPVSTPARPRL